MASGAVTPAAAPAAGITQASRKQGITHPVCEKKQEEIWRLNNTVRT